MAQREFGISFQARQTLLLQVKGAYDMKRIKRKVRRFVRLYWFWVTKTPMRAINRRFTVSVEQASDEGKF